MASDVVLSLFDPGRTVSTKVGQARVFQEAPIRAIAVLIEAKLVSS